MKNINYLSDLKIIEKYPQNVASFVYHFTTDCSNKCYDVSLELGNCFKLVKDGEELLVITLDSHGLKEGQLKVRRELNYVDDDFPDKEFNKVTENLYDIYLVDGKSDEVEDIEVEGYIPVFRGYSAYEIAVQQGFVGTEKEWLDSLKGYDSIKEDEYGVYITTRALLLNGKSLVTYDMLPQVQTSYGDAFNHYINSDGYTDSNKCALSAKHTTILQGTKGTWSEGKLLFRKGRWGDDGYSTIAIPTATNEYDGLLSKEDKAKIDAGVGGGNVDDVKVNGTSVVTDKVANIDLSTYATTNALTKVGNLAVNASSTATEALATANDKLSTDLSNISEGGKNVIKYNTGIFVAKYNVTPFEEVRAAINDGKKILVENLPNGSYITNVEVSLLGSNYVQFFGFRTSQSNSYNGYVSIELNGNRWITRKTGEFEENTNKKSTITDSTTYYPNNKAVIDYVAPIKEKVDNLELFKFPNATIFGQPTIQQGQISNFTAENYLQFPFIVDFQNRPWQIDMAVTMGADVSGQHNILDSNFGLAFAIQNTKLVLALSYDGVAWAGAYTSSTSIEPNKTYYIKIYWDGAIYKVDVSEDKTTYTNFISVNSTNTLYPRTITIGKSIDNRYIWNGSINFNEAKLTISDKVVWTGMDDAGLSTRLAVNLNNIDAEGKAKIKEIAGGDCNVFVATYRETPYEDIEEAYNSGKEVIFYYQNRLFTLCVKFPNDIVIFHSQQGGNIYNIECIKGVGWGGMTQQKSESTINKITTINSASTDLQYPSAKAVYDFVNNREWYGTQAEFDALTTYNENVNYYIYD